MNKELPKAYNPKEYEDRIYQKWEKSGFFNPDKCVKGGIAKKDAKNFSIALPPPNRTGVLHIGHALMLVIQDILTRYHRMKGEKTLWVPGTDHAAIATQSVVEKKLYKEEGKTRHDLGREEFLKRVREFADQSHKTITEQVKKMGSSLDWSREAYTLDEVRNRAVNTVFKMMSDDGLIYRGDRVINWCPRCHSTLSDDEVEYKTQKTKLYTFKYSKDFPFTIATTRPETKLGDTAVAVNPKDKRYKKYLGKTYDVDFVGVALKLKIIADRQVDMEFGTGAVGVTPAHSMADWQMAQDHKLDVVKVINEDGNIADDYANYAGKSVEQAREMIVKKLKEQGLLEKEEEMENNLSVCYRCHTPIEPLPSLQWFINVNKKLKIKNEKLKIDGEYSLKELALRVVKSGKIKITPERFEKNYFHWMDNLRDWCISRQIWFGHRVPAYYDIFDKNNKYGEIIFNAPFLFIKGDMNETVSKLEKNGYSENFSANAKTNGFNIYRASFDALKGLIELKMTTIIEVKKKLRGLLVERCNKIIVEVESSIVSETAVQDPDTLDTWFSSGLWTFSTLANNPDQIKIKDGKLIIDSDDFKNFHPTSMMETGYDILFFWVARMIIMTTYAIGDIPFKDVYLHGLVRDEKGRKMSKSLGNAIDPLDVCAKYGTDAVRLSLIIGTTPGNDINLSEEKIAGFRNFTNKLWNINRYIYQHYPEHAFPDKENVLRGIIPDTEADKWIENKFIELRDKTTKDIKEYRFSQAGERLREFTWNDFADWYLEVSKFETNTQKGPILRSVINGLLTLWHPFIPFITEAIWQSRERKKESFLMIEKWPCADKYKKRKNSFELIKEIIMAIRAARSENKVEPAKKIKAVIYGGKFTELIKSQEHLIKNLRTGIEELDVNAKGKKIKDAIYITVADVEIYLINVVDKEKKKIRIKKEIDNLEKVIAIIEKKLSNKQFVKKAPEKIVRQEKEKLKLWKEELKKIKK